ncbi:hypothetical protein [Dryocola sp. BD613]
MIENLAQLCVIDPLITSPPELNKSEGMKMTERSRKLVDKLS